MNFYEVDCRIGGYYHVTLADYEINRKDVSEISHGVLKPGKKYIFNVFSGKGGGDLITCDVPCVCIVSDVFLDLVKKNNLTGFVAVKIFLVDKKGIEIDGYNILSIVGKCSMFEYGEKTIKEQSQRNPNHISEYHIGIVINPSDWDGSDFFRCKGIGNLIISEKAFKIMEHAKLKNVQIKDVTKLKIPKFFVDIKSKMNDKK